MAGRKKTRTGSASSARSPKELRFHATLYVTQTEIRQLQARADADLRSISNYVSRLVVHDLRRPQAERKQEATGKLVARAEDRRLSYDVAIRLTAAARKKIAARAKQEMRAVGNYMTTLVLGDLRKG